MKLVKFPSNQHKTLIQSFISSTHHKGHPLLSSKLFDWFYLRSDIDFSLSFYIASEGDTLVSILGFYASDFLVDSRIVPGLWTAIWYTLPQYRNGIGALLMKELVDTNSVVCGLGASDMNLPIAKALGYKTVDKIYNYTFVLDPISLRNCFNWMPPIANKNLLLDVINYTNLKPFCNHASVGCNSFSFSPSLKPKHESNKILETYKSYDYIKWRYINHPFFDYQVSFITNLDGRPIFYLVWRLVDLKGATLCRIVDCDYIPDHTSINIFAGCLIYDLVLHLQSFDISYIDCFTNNPFLSQALLTVGFLCDVDSIFPNLIDPVDFTRPKLNCEYYVDPKICPSPAMINMRGDGDQDRPNQSVFS